MTLCVPLLFISCQKDDLFEDYVNQEDFSKPSLRILNNQEISQKTSLSRELQNIDVPSRTTFSNEDEDADPYFNLQDYKVITELAKEITSEEHITYTFSLKNKDEGFSSPKLFNIVFIKPSEEEEFTSKLLTVYHFSEDQRNEIENKTEPTGKFFISFHQIDENNEIYPPLKARGKGKGDEEEDSGVWFDPADYQEFDPVDGGGFFGDVIEVIIVAPGAPPPDDWTPGGGLPDWGDDGGIPDVNPPIEGGGGGGFTSPVHDPDPEDDPCSELSEQFDDEDLKNELSDLYANRNSSIEVGFSEDTDGTFPPGLNGTEHSIELQLSENTKGYAHLHPNTPMFSPKDFEIFWQLILKTNANSDTDPSQAYGIVLHDEKGYTLNFTGNYEDDWGILNNSRPQDDDMREKYNEMFEETFGDYEKTFISYVEEYMLNDNKKFSDFFELYEFDIDENGEISGLTNKYLDDDKIKSDPCD